MTDERNKHTCAQKRKAHKALETSLAENTSCEYES